MTNPWPLEAETFALRLWSEGKSGSEIASSLWSEHRLHKTRSAVIGRLHRIGATKRGPTSTVTRAQRREVSRRQRKFIPPARLVKVKPMPEPKPHAAEPESRNVPLVMLGAFECHWITDPTRFEQRYCGHGVALGSKYCPHHEARSRVPTVKKGRAR